MARLGAVGVQEADVPVVPDPQEPRIPSHLDLPHHHLLYGYLFDLDLRDHHRLAGYLNLLHNLPDDLDRLFDLDGPDRLPHHLDDLLYRYLSDHLLGDHLLDGHLLDHLLRTSERRHERQ